MARPDPNLIDELIRRRPAARWVAHLPPPERYRVPPFEERATGLAREHRDAVAVDAEDVHWVGGLVDSCILELDALAARRDQAALDRKGRDFGRIEPREEQPCGLADAELGAKEAHDVGAPTRLALVGV